MTKYFLTFVAIFVTFTKLIAQNSPQADTINDLQEVIVTYQAGQTTPVTFQNLTSKQLKLKITGQEPSFLLSETPSVTNYSDAGNSQGYSYFRMRGIDQTRINITLDGAPLNEPEDQGAYFSNYPDIFNSLSKVQIQRGVGTTKNGVASYGGSLQLFSPNLYDSAETTLGLGYGSFSSFRGFAEYKGGLKNRKALYVRASEIYSDGYKYHSSNHSQSLFLSGGLFFDKSVWKLNLMAGHQQNQMAWLGVKDSLIEIDRRTNSNSDEYDEFTQCFIQGQNKWQINSSSSLQSSIYYTYLKGNYDFDFNNFLGFPSTSELYNYAFQSNFLGFFSNYTLSKKSLTLTSGVHGNLYDRQHIGSEKALGKLYENTGYKDEISAFAKANYQFNRMTLFADIQYRYTNFNYTGLVPLDKLSWSFINPKAGISFEMAPGVVAYYSIGKTGREPTRNDLFGGNDDLLADSVGNADLYIKDPEYVVDHELGFRFNSRSLKAALNFYYMDFENEIVLNGNFGPNGLLLTDNVERSYRAGIELNVEYQLIENLLLVNNSSFNYSKIKEQGETFEPILTPPLIINQELIYNWGNFSAAIMAKYQDASFIDFANSASLNAYYLLNARLGYHFNAFEMAFFVNNITNSKYYNHGYVDYDGSHKYFVQSPTNFYFSIKYGF